MKGVEEEERGEGQEEERSEDEGRGDRGREQMDRGEDRGGDQRARVKARDLLAGLAHRLELLTS